MPTGDSYYFPLYRLSYMWYAPLGFLVTVLVAQLVSRIVGKCQRARGARVRKIDQFLLSPLFPHCLRSSERIVDPILLVCKISLILF